MTKHNKLKTYALGGALALSALFTSCKDKNGDKQDIAQKPQTEIKAEPKPMVKQKTVDDLRWEYQCKVRDSVDAENGADELREQLHAKPESWEDEQAVRDLEYPYSLGGVMDREVIEVGTKIIEDAYNQIVAGLAKYNVSLDGAISQDSTSFNIKEGVIDKWGNSAYKHSMCFIGIDDPDCYSSAEYEWNVLSRAIDTVISAADYGNGQKANMRTMVKNIIGKAKQDLIASRKFVESKYADYYSLANKRYIGLSAGGEGEMYYGYDDLNDNWWANPKYLNIERRVNVYDSKLTVDFFGDAGADYKLVSIGNGKWQVTKKSKDGSVSKTHIFEDSKDFSIDTTFSAESKKVGKYEFDFEPGYNYGVRVYSSEVIDVQRRKKDWTPKLPADVKHVVDSLNQEIKEKRKLSDKLWEKQNAADSIARIMTAKKFGPNGR